MATASRWTFLMILYLRRESCCFKSVVYSCFSFCSSHLRKNFGWLWFSKLKNIPNLTQEQSRQLFCREQTANLFHFCFPCFLKAYYHHKKNSLNFFDKPPFFHCYKRSEKLKEKIEASVGWHFYLIFWNYLSRKGSKVSHIKKYSQKESWKN